MRFKITLQRREGKAIPINYQYPLSAVIYKIIEKGNSECAQFLHTKGYGKGFKFFIFSQLNSVYKIASDRMNIESEEAYFFISFYLPLKTKHQQFHIDREKSNTQKETLTTTLTALETEAQKALQKMQDWLNDYNQKNNQLLSVEALHKLLALSNDWINTDQAALQTIEEQVNKSNTILTGWKQVMDSHKQNCVFEQPLEERLILNAAVKTEIEHKNKKHKNGENSFRSMDALERLHNQGYKVVVIFHVQEMTERIPVQIMVSKRRAGKVRWRLFDSYVYTSIIKIK